MRALLAALSCPRGNIGANLNAHLEALDTAAPGDLVPFPEVPLTGSASARHEQAAGRLPDRHSGVLTMTIPADGGR